VIPLNKNIQLLFGSNELVEEKIVPFDTSLLEEVAQFSNFLFAKKPSAEIVAFAFWCRRSNLINVSRAYTQSMGEGNHKVFHITPANVDTVYLYALILSFLVGNYNVVRVSDRRGAIADELLNLLLQFSTSTENSLLLKRCSVISYPSYEEEVTQFYSNWCSKRVVWGGSNAIASINKIVKVIDQIEFPDRFSVAVIKLTNKAEAFEAAKKFCTDYLSFTQQACSSPKSIFWYETEAELKQMFWQKISVIAKGKSEFKANNHLNRHINLQKILIQKPEITPLSFIADTGFLAVNLSMPNSLNYLEEHEGNGLVFTCDIESLKCLPTHKKLQTITYFGLPCEEVRILNGLRIVPMGEALMFSHVWDGINLIERLSEER